MRVAFVKSCAPQMEMLLRQPTSIQLREWFSEEVETRTSSSLDTGASGGS